MDGDGDRLGCRRELTCIASERATRCGNKKMYHKILCNRSIKILPFGLSWVGQVTCNIWTIRCIFLQGTRRARSVMTYMLFPCRDASL